MDGVRHAKSTRTGNRRLAEVIDQRFKDDLNLKRLGIRQPAPEMTFGALTARFLAEGVSRPYHNDRLKMLLPYFGDTEIGRIDKATVREYRQYRHSQKAVSDTTVNRDVELLRHVLFWAVDEGLLVANPLSRVPFVKERRKPRPVMTLAEERALLEAAAPHLHPIIIAALDTGMRRGEILGERWEHVDFDRGLLYVTKSKTAGGEGREIPLTRRLSELLLAHRRDQGLVFTFNGQPVQRIKTAWRSAIRRANIRYCRFHDLRHAFNTRLMEAGVMQEVRKALMGHSSGEDVHSRYTHVELPLKREAIRKLETWMSNHNPQLNQKGGDRDSTESSGPGFPQVSARAPGRESQETVGEEDSGGSRP
jgi:integrase